MELTAIKTKTIIISFCIMILIIIVFYLLFLRFTPFDVSNADYLLK